MRLRALAIFSASAALAAAQFSGPSAPQEVPRENQGEVAEPAKPAIKKLDETRFQVGEVIFDQKSREIRFPARVNMTEGLLEYLVVHQNGKIHESLFSTEIAATHLNLAFTLLRYKPSRELYAIPSETGGVSNRFEDVPADIKAAARVNLFAEWKEKDKTRKFPVNELIQQEAKGTAMPVGPWVYGGSDFHDGKFVAQTTGDIAAIFSEMASLINYPGEDNGDDTVWIPFPKRLPPTGTEVTIIISPHQKTKPAPTP